MSNLPVTADSLLPPGHNDEYKTAKINSCAQLEALPESEVASPAKALDLISRLRKGRFHGCSEVDFELKRSGRWFLLKQV